MQTEEWLHLLLWQEKALRALHQAIDAAYLVLIASSSAARPKPAPRTSNHDWLGSFHPAIRDTFRQATKSIREDLEIVNRMKHANASLSPFLPRNSRGPLPCYYFQGISRTGALGPDPLCNPHATAFSFARDVRVRALQFHLLDEALADSANSIISETGRSLVEPHGKLLDGHERWEEILDAVEAFPTGVLPDEALKPLPVVSKVRRGTYEIEAKGRSGRLLPFTGGRVVMSGDGMTRNGRLPYPETENGKWDLDASF